MVLGVQEDPSISFRNPAFRRVVWCFFLHMLWFREEISKIWSAEFTFRANASTRSGEAAHQILPLIALSRTQCNFGSMLPVPLPRDAFKDNWKCLMRLRLLCSHWQNSAECGDDRWLLSFSLVELILFTLLMITLFTQWPFFSGAHGVGRRHIKNTLINKFPERFSYPIPRK